MLGAMRLKITIFKGRNSVCRVAKNFQPFYVGGDTTENHDFQRGKQRLQCSIFYDFQKMTQRFQVVFSGGDLEEKGIFPLGQGCEKIETDP